MAEGVSKFHFFTLNKSDLAVAVCRSLGLASAQLSLRQRKPVNSASRSQSSSLLSQMLTHFRGQIRHKSANSTPFNWIEQKCLN